MTNENNPLLYRVHTLTAEEAAIFAKTARALTDGDFPGVYDRDYFKTIGAAAYLDGPEAYETRKASGNPLISLFFGGLVSKVVHNVAATLHTSEMPVNLSMHAHPGFHVFDSRANGLHASIHTDEPFDRTSWPCVINRAASFTLCLEVPAVGAGLNVWMSETDDDPATIIYEPGMLYVHSGAIKHQIAQMGALEPDERRITLQGHVACLDDGTQVFYF